MPREFEMRKEAELDATPEQVWEAITTPAAWLFETQAVPEGATVVAWNPPNHFSVRLPAAEDGTTHAFEYLIEAREGGSTVLRFVHSGFLSDNWDSGYEDLTSHGWDMYLHTLALYLKHFAGRPATYVEADAPPSSAAEEAWPVLLRELGVTEPLNEGDRVRLTPEGLPPIEGVADSVAEGCRLTQTGTTRMSPHASRVPP
ncbi:SRPBCC family protein [Longimycelium tulufanense]|nr:SRPBCC domain-containing protein [Longimycelium tulufanense]